MRVTNGIHFIVCGLLLGACASHLRRYGGHRERISSHSGRRENLLILSRQLLEAPFDELAGISKAAG